MLYLSKIVLNPRSRQVQSELRNRYEMHRTLSRGFDDGPGGYTDARVLFRVDGMDSARPYILVQSLVRPDWGYMESNGYSAAAPVVKEFSPVFRNGDVYAFRLVGNPTIKRAGKRVGLYGESEHLKWLDRKASANGFHVLSARSLADKINSGGCEGGETVFCSVQFDGVLQLTHPAVFGNAVENGIGSAKGFGFGLLSIAPCR
jgi:CRISPR system Cascade subunit CasE